MKDLYIKDILHNRVATSSCSTMGWIKSKRTSKQTIFIDLCDSTGCIQLVLEKATLGGDIFNQAKKITIESAIEISGTINDTKNNREIIVNSFTIISAATKHFTPELRSDFDVFDEKYTSHILSNRHLYIRNPKLMAIQKFRNLLLYHMRTWFFENDFLEIAAPVLTNTTLYDAESTAIPVNLHGQSVFLSQCAGYYLEASAMAFEKVYNISPSFRAEESKSKRHLIEYWHIKAELTFGNLEDIINIVETIIRYLIEKLQQEKEIENIFKTLDTEFCLDGLKTPYPHISYEEAVSLLQENGCDIKFGESIGNEKEEKILFEKFRSPLWLMGMPRSVEPFPYVIDEKDNRVTKTADLIASNLCGELLGVAEKIYDIQMLDERFREKGLNKDARYEWIRDVHKMGCVPHIAFGMGVERLIRWLMNIPHVRDAHPFPRIFDRKFIV
ncbi:asparagine--tRNA ligase [Bacteroidia bacterium]|nr:asparagine--tRNA ligase [Bacteroidia bacterium]